MLSAFNIVDLVFLFFSLVFVITAVFRGLIKEVFAFSNWILSFSLSYALAPYVGVFLKNYISNKMFADLGARALIFVTIFLIIAISTSKLVKNLKDVTPVAIDRSLGVVFAIFKTLIIFGFVYSIYINMYGFLMGSKLNDKKDIEHPKIFLEAKSFSIIKKCGEFVNPVVKLFFDAIAKNIEFTISKSMELDGMNEMMKDSPISQDELNTLINQNAELESNQESGYEKKDIDKINNLIDNIDKKK